MRYSNLLVCMFHAQATYEDHNVQEFSTLVSLGGDQGSYFTIHNIRIRQQDPKTPKKH